MKILDILTGELSIPLQRPFITAYRTVTGIHDVVVKIVTDTALFGLGEAPPTPEITGETKASIRAAIKGWIRPALLGLTIENPDQIMEKLQHCIEGNFSAKSAVDMAFYDLFAKQHGLPLYQLLGGYRDTIQNDRTISLHTKDAMLKDSLAAVRRGYRILKIKAGKDPKQDIATVRSIRKAVGKDIRLRIDANQGWQPKEAVFVIRTLENAGANIELAEQPVNARHLAGMKFVKDHVATPILADESVFSPLDAARVLQRQAADMINIKLAKTGGIYNALKVCTVAELYHVPCLMGCMLEGPISAGAAAHLACAKSVITKADIDAPGLSKWMPHPANPVLTSPYIKMNQTAGIGFDDLAEAIHWY